VTEKLPFNLIYFLMFRHFLKNFGVGTVFIILISKKDLRIIHLWKEPQNTLDISDSDQPALPTISLTFLAYHYCLSLNAPFAKVPKCVDNICQFNQTRGGVKNLIGGELLIVVKLLTSTETIVPYNSSCNICDKILGYAEPCIYPLLLESWRMHWYLPEFDDTNMKYF